MRLILSVVVGCLLALSTAACTGDDPPAAAPTTSATSTPANPDATLPALPDRIGEDSPSGAATFLRYYVAVLDYAIHTGDTKELRRLSTADCKTCWSYIDAIDTQFTNGGFVRGGHRTYDASELRYAGPDGETSAAITMTITEGERRERGDSQAEEFPSAEIPLTFYIVGLDDRKVARIVQSDAT